MKKAIYQGLYQTLLFLSNHLNSKLVIKYKVLLGTSLLLLINACQMSKKNNSNFVTCYDPSPINDDMLEVQATKPDEPEDVLCYVPKIDNDTVKVATTKQEEPFEISCYDIEMPSCYDIATLPEDTLEISAVKPDEPVEVNCYEIPEPRPGSDENYVYITVDVMPEFQGGEQALSDYLEKSIRYPEKAKDEGIQGRVIVTFVVNRDGSVSDAKIVRSSNNPLLDKEALRIIYAMPSWKPGRLKDIAVRVQYTVPVRFRLRD